MLVRLKNIQSIEDATYDMPETGVVQIVGGNSNGKSILVKALESVAKMTILDKDTRLDLLRRGTSTGYICMSARNRKLVIRVEEELSSCTAAYEDEYGEKIVRNFRDKGIDVLVHKFGWRTYDKNNICLQIRETYGQVPFVNTSDRVNSEIVQSVMEDASAKRFLESFKNYTQPKAREMLKVINIKIQECANTKAAIRVYDYKMYEKYREDLSKMYSIVKFIRPVTVQKTEVPPELEKIDLAVPKVRKVTVPPVVEIVDLPAVKVQDVSVPISIEFPRMGRVNKLLETIEELESGTCPTCGRSFREDLCG